MGHTMVLMTEEEMTKGFRWEGNAFVHVRQTTFHKYWAGIGGATVDYPEFSDNVWEVNCDLCDHNNAWGSHSNALDEAQEHAQEHAHQYRRPMAYS